MARLETGSSTRARFALMVLLLTAQLCALALRAQAPATDIAVIELAERAGGGFAVQRSWRVSDRPEYDNQPSFHGDDVLLYTAQAVGGSSSTGASAEDAGTDLVRFDLRTGERALLVNAPESEYSPTVVPLQPGAPGTADSGSRVSFIRDFGNQRQELWSAPLFPAGGAAPSRNLLPGIAAPIGYHAWVDAQRVLLFVLGEPATLQLATIGSAAGGAVVARNPGRALARIPGSSALSFVQLPEAPGDSPWLCRLDVGPPGEPPRITRLVEMPPGSEHQDYAWARDGSVWIGRDSTLFRAAPKPPVTGATDSIPQWEPVLDLAPSGFKGITRLAMSPSGRRLALAFSR